jgi:hypothetical protein
MLPPSSGQKILGGDASMWLICPTPCVVCVPYYLRFLTFFLLCFWVVESVMRWLALILVIICFLCIGMVLHHFLVRCDLCHFFLLMGFLLALWDLV